MKSTVRYEKTYIYGILMLIGLFILPINPAWAGYGLKMKDAYLTFFMEIDDRRIVKLRGLPLEGEYYFDLNKAALIFTPKNSKNTYRLNVAPLERGLPKARFSRDTSYDDKMFLGYESRYWKLSTYKEDCKEIFSSQKLAKKIKMTMTDLSRINLALSYLTGQNLSDPCSSHVVSKAMGNLIGLPLYSYSLDDHSNFEIKAILEDKSLKNHKLPVNIKPFDKEARASYFETLLTEDAYKSYRQTVHLLGRSGITQIKALQQLLKNPVNRRQIVPIHKN